jgi:hypothetical protein
MSEIDSTPADTDAQKMPTSFVYDDEHPQIQMPFTAQVGDRRLEGKSISITQALVSGLLPPSGERERTTIVLRFDFESFTISLFVEATVEKIGTSENPEIQLRFCDPTASHIAPLRYILNSHLAGDLITVGRFLGYTGPTQMKDKPPASSPKLMQRARNSVRKAGLVALGVGLIAMAANVVRERVMFSYEARPVTISQSGETLRATAAGQITFANTKAREGEVAYSISANSGDLLSVRMPCDCDIIAREEFYEGATILAGTPLVKLVRDDAAMEATAQISFAGVARWMAGDTVELEFSDGQILPVDLSLIESGAADPAADVVLAQLALGDLDAQSLEQSQTARLRFRRQLLPDFIQDAGSWFQ